jgi:nicotinamidase-related amidase
MEDCPMIVVDGKEVFTTIEEIVRPQHCALLVIDVQNVYFSDESICGRSEEFDISALKATLPRMCKVVEEARVAGALLIYIQEIAYPNHLTDSPASIRFRMVRYGLPPGEYFELKGSWESEIVDEIAPGPDDIIVTKHRSSAFVGTSLDLILRSNSIKSVVVIGDVTQGCVESTARDALFYDYYPVVISDAVASLDARLHEASLFVMASRLDVTTSDEVFRAWHKEPYPPRARQAEVETSSKS